MSQKSSSKRKAAKQPRQSPRKTYLLVGLGIILLSVALLVLKVSAGKQTVSVLDGLDPNQPQQVLDRIVARMDEVAQKTQNQDALKLAKFIRENCLVARMVNVKIGMTSSAQQALYERNGQEITKQPKIRLGFFVVKPEDITPETKLFFAENADERMFYSQEFKSILISSKRLTEFSEEAFVFIFFHEALHAYQDYRDNYRSWGPEQKKANDDEAYAFERRLLGEYLGERYFNLINRMSAEVQFIQNGKEIGVRPNFRPEHKDKLQKMLWHPQGKQDLWLINLMAEMSALDVAVIRYSNANSPRN